MDIIGEGKTFASYRAMHDIVIGNNADIKKWTKRDPQRGTNRFKELLVTDNEPHEWDRKTLAEFSRDLLGSFNASQLLSPALRDKLEKKEIESIDDYHGKDIYWFVVTDVKPKLTKNGRPYLLLTVTGAAGGNTRIFCWGWDGKTEFEPFTTCVAEVDKNDFGCSTKMRRLKVLNG